MFHRTHGKHYPSHDFFLHKLFQALLEINETQDPRTCDYIPPSIFQSVYLEMHYSNK